MNTWLQNMTVYLLIIFAMFMLPVLNTQDKLESRSSVLLGKGNIFSFAFYKQREQPINLQHLNIAPLELV